MAGTADLYRNKERRGIFAAELVVAGTSFCETIWLCELGNHLMKVGWEEGTVQGCTQWAQSVTTGTPSTAAHHIFDMQLR